MSAGITVRTSRVALRGAAIVAIAGFAAGCSSGVQRFSDTSLFTGSTQNQRAIISKSVEEQPYPGDLGVKPVSSPDYTGSVNRSAVEPVNLNTGSIARSELPPVGQTIKTKAAAIAAPAVAAVAAAKSKVTSLKPSATASKAAASASSAAKSTYDSVTTSAIAKPVATSGDAVKRGWSAAGGTTITLREGETLYNLSRRFGVPVSAIVSANGLKDASSVAAGQKIVIPTYVYSSDVPVSAPDSNPDVAAAKSSRGRKTDTPANKVPAGVPEKSSVAVLPTETRPRQSTTAAATPGSKTASATPKSTGSATVAGGYKVQSGDSLWSIAKKMNTTTAALKAANKLDGSALRVGQVLVIPTATTTTTVASAKAANVDPIITGSTKTTSKTTAATANTQALPTQTAPKKAEAAFAEAEKSAAVAPEQTGIGKMRWPAKGRVVASYGSKDNGSKNDGIDISLPSGTPVKAAENGVVIYADSGLKELGNTVLIRHEDGLVTVYAHNGDLKVKRGDKVTRGQQIASSGMTGDAKSPMLHFEVRKDSAPVDPTKFLD